MGIHLSLLMCMFPPEVKQRDAVPTCLSSQTVNKCPSHDLFSAVCFTFLCSSLVILLFKMAPRSNAEGPSSVPKHRKAVICLMEKLHVLDKLCLDMSSSAVDHKFYVNESTISAFKGVFKQKHT